MKSTVSLRLSATRIYFVLRNHIIEGPFSVVELRSMLSRGEIVPETPVCLALDRDWVPLFKKVRISGMKQRLSSVFIWTLIVFVILFAAGAGYHYRDKLWKGEGYASYGEVITAVDMIKSQASYTHFRDRKMAALNALRLGLEKISAGGDINGWYGNDAPALVNAALVANKKTLRFLIERGAKVETTNSRGEIPLMNAAVAGNKDNFDYLLEKGSDINHRDFTGWTLLMAASQGGNVEIVKYLVGKKMTLDSKDCWGNYALLCAEKEKNQEVVDYLKSLSR